MKSSGVTNLKKNKNTYLFVIQIYINIHCPYANMYKTPEFEI